ncbi:hypothetical protein [Paenibacillus daejeonensis]|uniref:hypothetical protein n=1 Tax=Paenibacillus daejeonensis TaxID=135193 RepID=UPI000373F82A|nr:hypothetical protein [Paenibacillus daejeonensis]
MRNQIRVGTVSTRSEERQAVKVVIEDQEDLVTDWLQIIYPPVRVITDSPVAVRMEVQLPAVGETVLCVFLSSGLETGYCLGRVGGT